jgi:hypothetical protein
VDQRFVHLDSERLLALEAGVRLVPNLPLDRDSFPAAMFEWMERRLRDPALVDTWVSECRFKWVAAESSEITRLFEVRTPPHRLERWMIVPRLTAHAALAIAVRADEAEHERTQLLAALAFAPSLVAYDLLLAHALAARAPRRPDA